MSAENVFEKVSAVAGQDVLELTFTVIDSFCPEMKRY